MSRALCIGILMASMGASATAQTPSSAPAGPAATAAGHAATAPGPAATAPGPAGVATARVTVSGWSVECGTHGSALSCYALDRMTQTGSNALLSTISISIAPDTKQPTLVLQLPLGIAVSQPVDLSVGESPAQRFSVLTCNGSGCFVRGVLQPDLLAAMQTPSHPLRIAYATLDAGFRPQAVTMILGLDGFAAAYTKMK